MKNTAEKCGSRRSFILTLLNFRARTVAVLSGVLFQGVIVGSGFADEVIRWNQVATDASTAHKVDPLPKSQDFGIVHIPTSPAPRTQVFRNPSHRDSRRRQCRSGSLPALFID